MVTLSLSSVPTPEVISEERRKMIVDVTGQRKKLLISASYLLLFVAILYSLSVFPSMQFWRDRLHGLMVFLVAIQSYLTLRRVPRLLSALSSHRTFDRIYPLDEN